MTDLVDKVAFSPGCMLTVGLLLLAALALDALGRRTRVPRVTLLLLFGVACGPVGLGLLPTDDGWFEVTSHIALVMVGFMLGGSFTLQNIRRYGRQVFWASVSVVMGTALVMVAGLWGLGVQLPLALLFAGVALATDPAATLDVTREVAAEGPYTEVLLGIVAVDDAWGLIVFSLLLSLAQGLTVSAVDASLWWHCLWDLGGALLLGVGLGLPGAFLTGRIRPGEPTMLEAVGLVLVCGGLALWLQCSYLLAAMVLGAVVANFARHHKRPFHAVHEVEWPFMVLFFVFAGATLEPHALVDLGFLGMAFVALRVLGRFLGGYVGGWLGGLSQRHRLCLGWSLLPQAGVALGMALAATERLPYVGAQLLPVVIGTTVLFELLGPLFTRWSLQWLGEGVQTPAPEDEPI